MTTDATPERSAPPRILSIAGTDPSGGAGIQADLKSIAANGGYGMAVVTALVAQNTHGVRSVHTPPASFLVEQLDAVSDDVSIDAVKIGMLGTVDTITAVAEWLDRIRPPFVVLDPVMVATSGDRLLEEEAESALRELLARADVVTPNIPELAILAEEPPAASWEAVISQARRVSTRYGVLVLAKGGHLPGPMAPDALVDAAHGLPGRRDVVEFAARRVHTVNTHGTGCSLSSALATRRAQSLGWVEALTEAKAWLGESIAAADELEVGGGRGPINHFAGLWARGGLVTSPDASQLRHEWWESIAEIRAEIDELEFVRSLGDGSLAEQPFRWYLAQDALYLRDYARVLAAASALAPTAAEQAFWAEGAAGSIVAELSLHEDWLGAHGLESVEPGRVTSDYLNHLLATAARGDYPTIIAALLPCFWLYQDVGARLHPRAHPEHPYRSWLDTYGDEAFAAATERAIETVTAVAAGADATTRARMLRAFTESSRFEREFFAAPLRPDAAR